MSRKAHAALYCEYEGPKVHPVEPLGSSHPRVAGGAVETILDVAKELDWFRVD